MQNELYVKFCIVNRILCRVCKGSTSIPIVDRRGFYRSC